WGSTSSGRMPSTYGSVSVGSVVGLPDAGLEAFNAVGLLAVHVPSPAGLLPEPPVEQRAEDDDRLAGALLADLFGHFEAFPVRHYLVEHDDVRVEVVELGQRVIRRGHADDVVPVVGEDALDERDHLRVVLDEQHPEMIVPHRVLTQFACHTSAA